MSTCKIQDNRIGDGGDWIHLAWDRDTFRAVVHTVMNVRYAEARNLWTSSATVSFPNTVLHGVFRFYFRNIFCDRFNGAVAKDYCKTCIQFVCPDCVPRYKMILYAVLRWGTGVASELGRVFCGRFSVSCTTKRGEVVLRNSLLLFSIQN